MREAHIVFANSVCSTFLPIKFYYSDLVDVNKDYCVTLCAILCTRNQTKRMYEVATVLFSITMILSGKSCKISSIWYFIPSGKELCSNILDVGITNWYKFFGVSPKL